MEFNLETIIAIVTSLTSLGLFVMLKSLIKEVKEVVEVYKVSKVDGITEQEMNRIAKESIDVIEQVIKISYLIKRFFSKK